MIHCPNCGTTLATETLDGCKVVFCLGCGVKQEQKGADDADI